MKQIAGGVCAATGFSASGVHCGIRKNKTKRDLALIYSSVPASAASILPTARHRPSSATAATPTPATPTALQSPSR